MTAHDFDVAIVGAGIVGTSIAWHLVRLSPGLKVLVVEAESQPGCHATGRSAALYAASYGPPMVRALTRAGREFFQSPPTGFTNTSLLHPRGTLFVGGPERLDALRSLHRQLAGEGVAAHWLEGDEARRRVPVLRPEACAGAVYDADAFDIDVDALLQGFVRGSRAGGVEFRLGGGVVAVVPREAGGWLGRCSDGSGFTAATLVDAAGAWADEVAALAGVARVGIEPRRRSAFLFQPPDGLATSAWPAVVDVDEGWYFKPDAGLLLGSPANADPVPPHDVVAEEFDVALGIHRIETATTMTIRRPRSTWAGLRSFVADGEPVAGPDAAVPGFFWAAALGGYGIQSAPGFGSMCAHLLLGRALPDALLREGLEVSRLSVGRLR